MINNLPTTWVEEFKAPFQLGWKGSGVLKYTKSKQWLSIFVNGYIQSWGVTKKGGPTNPLDMTDDPTCLNSNECFLTLKPVNFSDQLLQSLSLHTLIIDRQGLHTHQFHRNVCRSKGFQLYSHGLQLHKHTNAQYLDRSHLTLDRTTKTKPQSLPLIPALLVLLTK
jgi:hypothetical protein